MHTGGRDEDRVSESPRRRVQRSVADTSQHEQAGAAWPGWCSDWRTTYADLPDQTLRPNRAFAQVRVSLYKTHRAALVALDEPAYGPMLRLPSGALTRTLVSSPSVNGDATREVGGVASVVGNVFISSVGQGRPPAHRGSEAVRAQMRIHRRIQAAVLALG